MRTTIVMYLVLIHIVLLSSSCSMMNKWSFPNYTEIVDQQPLPIDGLWTSYYWTDDKIVMRIQNGKIYTVEDSSSAGPVGAVYAKEMHRIKPGYYKCKSASCENIKKKTIEYRDSELIIVSANTIEWKNSQIPITESNCSRVFALVELDNTNLFLQELESVAEVSNNAYLLQDLMNVYGHDYPHIKSKAELQRFILDLEGAKRTNSLKFYEAVLRRHWLQNDEMKNRTKDLVIPSLRYLVEHMNTVDGYAMFLHWFPDDEHAERYESHVLELDLLSAQHGDSLESYEAFLNKYRLNNEAQLMIRSSLLGFVKSKDTVSGYELFIKWFPNDSNAESFWTRRAQITAELYSQKLAEEVLKLAIYSSSQCVSTLDNPSTDQWRYLSSDYVDPRKECLAKIEIYLMQGANQDAKHITGFQPPTVVQAQLLQMGKKSRLFIHHNAKGRVVNASQGGISLIEFSRQNKLHEAVKLLQTKVN